MLHEASFTEGSLAKRREQLGPGREVGGWLVVGVLAFAVGAIVFIMPVVLLARGVGRCGCKSTYLL